MVWTYVAYMDSGEDCGVWGTRTNTPDSLQNIKVGSRRSEFDDRLEIDRMRDVIINKRMASAFHETNLQSLFIFHTATPWWSPAAPPRAACAPRSSTRFRAATAPSFRRNAWPTSTRARISPISTTWRVKYGDVVPVSEVIAHLRTYKKMTQDVDEARSRALRLPAVQQPAEDRLAERRADRAFWVAPNIEFYELEPPRNPTRTPWPRPVPDVLGYSYRDYGNRAGFWRMMEAMDSCGLRGSVSLNVALCEHHPEIIEACAERGWEFFSHGIYNTRYTYGMSEDAGARLIQDSIDTIRKHTGQKLDGLACAGAHPTTLNTHGSRCRDTASTYICDLFHDDQPMPVKVKRGRLISMPYSLEMNDAIVYNTNLYPPRHYGETSGASSTSCAPKARIPALSCASRFIRISSASRIGSSAFAEALRYIAAHDNVWLTTGREIAQHFYAHFYHKMAESIDAAQA